MISNFNGHAVICGLNAKSTRVISAFLEQGLNVVLIAEEGDEIPLFPENRVGVITGDFLSASALAKAGIERASSVVILADTHRRSPADADARSVMATLGIRAHEPNLHIVVECLQEDSAQHLNHAGADEIIGAGPMTAEFLALSARHPGFGRRLKDLLSLVYCGALQLEYLAVSTPTTLGVLREEQRTKGRLMLGVFEGERLLTAQGVNLAAREHLGICAKL